MHTTLTCAKCHLDHPIDRLQNLCTNCSRPLVAGYDLESLREKFTPEAIPNITRRTLLGALSIGPAAN